MKFGPMPATMRVGDRILWVNRDLFRHTATADDKSFDVDLPPGAKKSSVIEKSGATSVVCRYHPGMRTSFKASR